MTLILIFNQSIRDKGEPELPPDSTWYQVRFVELIAVQLVVLASASISS
jgi:hypothetical protein